MSDINHICDQCGKPATHAARDMIEVAPISEFRKFEPYGEVKYGCDDHSVKSHTYNIGDQDYPLLEVG